MDITNKSYSIRFNAEEAPEFADFIADYQSKHGITFENMKQLFLHMVSNIENIETKEEIGEHILINDIRESASNYAEKFELPVESTTIQIVTDALTQEREKTVEITELVNELGENDVILRCSPDEMICLKSINSNRNKTDWQGEEIQVTARRLLFNQAVRENRYGHEYTGWNDLHLSQIKKNTVS